MEKESYEIGRIVIAKAGRDEGKAFLIIGIIDSEYVWISDGATRRIGHPKKKKVKHLVGRPELIEDLKIKLQRGQKVFDAEIRKALIRSGYEIKGG
jgi:large subunit ribosomal protein L14e